MKRLLVIFIPLLFAACTLIDDDLSVCGEELLVNYQLQLRTELSMQLRTELYAETDTMVRQALEGWLSPIFTDKAKDIDLHFFSAGEDVIRHRIQDVINANQTSYTINLPKEDYMHLGLANIADNHQLSFLGREHSRTMELALSNKAMLESMNTGVFTARLPMSVDDKSTQFDVFLYMVNAAVALVIDTTECDSLVAMRGTLNDGACGFFVRDSVFDFSRVCAYQLVNVPIEHPAGAPASKRSRVQAEETIQPKVACLATVAMPTRDGMAWTMTFNAALTNNRVTTTTLTIPDALQAGTLRVLRLRMTGNGGLEMIDDTKEVGVIVTLDWKNGGEHDIDLDD